MKLFTRVLQWLVLAPLDFLFMLVALLFVNWWAIFFTVPVTSKDWLWVKKSKPDYLKWLGTFERLPNWLKWFDTFDASTDTGWISGYFVPDGTYTPDNIPSYWKRKYYQWRWLNRNTGYGFSYWALGIDVNKADWTINVKEGSGYRLLTGWSTTGYWCVNLQGKFGNYKLGWRIQNYWDAEKNKWFTDNKPWGPEWRTQIVMSVNPFDRDL